MKFKTSMMMNNCPASNQLYYILCGVVFSDVFETTLSIFSEWIRSAAGLSKIVDFKQILWSLIKFQVDTKRVEIEWNGINDELVVQERSYRNNNNSSNTTLPSQSYVQLHFVLYVVDRLFTGTRKKKKMCDVNCIAPFRKRRKMKRLFQGICRAS